MEPGKSNAQTVRTGKRHRSSEAAVTVNIDPTTITTTGLLNHLVMGQVRCHKHVVNVASVIQTIDPVRRLDCRVLIVGELAIWGPVVSWVEEL